MSNPRRSISAQELFAEVFRPADEREARNQTAAARERYGSKEWFAAMFGDAPHEPRKEISSKPLLKKILVDTGNAHGGPGRIDKAPHPGGGADTLGDFVDPRTQAGNHGPEPGPLSGVLQEKHIPAASTLQHPSILGSGGAALTKLSTHSPAPQPARPLAPATAKAAAQTPPPTPQTRLAQTDTQKSASGQNQTTSNNTKGNPSKDNTTQPPKSAASTPKTSIDYGFIREKEGYKEEAYVPTNTVKVREAPGVYIPKKTPIGKSGVTIGYGHDLGQWDEQGQRKLGLSDNLHNKLKPYLGLKGKEATQYIKNNPLRLNVDEIKELTNAAEKHYTNEAKRVFDSHSNNTGKIKFENLDPAAQTIFYSLVYNMGSKGVSKDVKIVTKALSKKDYAAAIRELQSNNWDGNLVRRKEEGRYLKDKVKDTKTK